MRGEGREARGEGRHLISDIDLGGLNSVEKILAWMKASDVPMPQLDLIAQDEFSHDMLVPWRGRWLAFGVT